MQRTANENAADLRRFWRFAQLCNFQPCFRVGHSFLGQMKGVGHISSIHHIFKCSARSPPPRPLLLDQSIAQESFNRDATAR